ncbi:MAG TPA: hypothetical protein VGK58_03530 [Lacipirellulaceae bacterium]
MLRELQNRNPVQNDRHKHHQHLTEDVGHPKLLQHLRSVETLMRLSRNWAELETVIEEIHPVQKDLRLFDHLEED